MDRRVNGLNELGRIERIDELNELDIHKYFLSRLRTICFLNLFFPKDLK